MLCASCVHWTVELLSCTTLEERWIDLIETSITPGYREKYVRESEKQGIAFSQTNLYFKYCNKGQLTRFYVMRDPEDVRPRKAITECNHYSASIEALEGVPIPGPFWNICSTESHGTSDIKGQRFHPGLYEGSTYFRIPAHKGVRPEVGVAGKCMICENEFKKGIQVTETSSFCCNKHYLEWWKARNPDAFLRLNRT